MIQPHNDDEVTVHMFPYPFKAGFAEYHLGASVGEFDDDLGVGEMLENGILHSQLVQSALSI